MFNLKLIQLVMKKLSKFKIYSEDKVLKNNELKNLRGGASWYHCTCTYGGVIYFEEDILLESWAIDRYLENTCWQDPVTHEGDCQLI